MAKYALIHDALRAKGLLNDEDVMTPEESPREDLERVHTRDYLDRLFGAGLSPAQERLLGVPWSARLMRRSRLAVSGTCLAAEAALGTGRAGNLAGGTHHAFADHAEGFCVLNDVAIAIRLLQAQHRIARALIIDLDVHQGNGTAAIFENDPDVFTFSIHGEKNYPARKQRSTLDVGLPDGTDDARYLETLEAALPRLVECFVPDLVFYLAGVDVVAGDRYGRFALTERGLRMRERRVLEWCDARGLPLAITLAGGYAATAERTAALHALIFEEAARR